MTVAISIIMAVFAAIIMGAVAFGLLSLLPESSRRVRSPLSILIGIAVGIAVGFAASQMRVPAEDTRSSLERLIAQSDIQSMADALRQSDPRTYRDVIRSAHPLAQHGADDAALARVRASLVSAARDKYILLGDTFHVQRHLLTSAELHELAETQPSLCWPIVHGRVTEILDFPLSRDLLDQERVTLRTALSVDPTLEPAAPLDPDVFQATMSDLYERLGEDRVSLLQSSPLASEERRYCEVAAEYHRLLASVPQPSRLLATGENRAER